MNIFEKLVGEVKLISRFLNRSNSPSNKASLKSSTGNIVQQAGRDLNIGVGNNEFISNLEKRVMYRLYKKYLEENKLFQWKFTDACGTLGIADGSYVGTLNDSKYVKLDGEYLVLTSDGIRYMDSRFNQNRPRIDLDGSLAVIGSGDGNFIQFRVKNAGPVIAAHITFQLKSDETETPLVLISEKLLVEKSSNYIQYRYTDTDFFRKELGKPRIVFNYRDQDGNDFVSGWYIPQRKRADGNFNIDHLGDYFGD